MNIKRIVTIIFIIILAWLIFVRKPAFLQTFFSRKSNTRPTEIQSGFGGQLFDKIEQNSADNAIKANPFNNNINPYEGAYINPFK